MLPNLWSKIVGNAWRNLTLRFLLELATLLGLGIAGWSLSDASSFTTGTALFADGGVSINRT